MSESHLQVNLDGTTSSRKTVLWSNSKKEQESIIRGLFERNNWKVTTIENQSGSFWKVVTGCHGKILKLNLYISSVRDEDRQPDEFKMQLGNMYPQNDESGWITLVIGIYTIMEGYSERQYILSGYDKYGYDFSTNPSLRGTRTSGLQKAYNYGMYKAEKCIMFRPEFIYYYIENSEALFGKSVKQSPVIPVDDTIMSTRTNSYLTAICTKPFLLLAGISGTGKSRIVRELAFKSCPKYLQDKEGTTPGNYCMIEVKPNWHDSTELLGYYSNLSKSYQFKKFVMFLVKAKMFPKVPFFVCLDEMNLAPVEHYFAEMLSILETRKHPKKEGTDEVNMEVIMTDPIVEARYFRELGRLSNTRNSETGLAYWATLTDRDIYMKLYGIETESDIDPEVYKQTDLTTTGLTLPDNVIIIGTVNMDDTTHQFSRKVIDRAMTIEMNGGRLSEMYGGSKDLKYLDEAEQQKWQAAFRQRYVTADEVLEVHDDVAKDIVEKVPERLEKINEALKGTPFEVSYRVLNELTIMIGVMLDDPSIAGGIDTIIDQAIDRILLMKILPRMEGDRDMFNISSEFKKKNDITYDNRLEWLKELAPDIATDANKPHQQTAREKIQEMIERLENQEFTRFWP